MEDIKEYLSIVAEEYKSLRDEIKQASINMFSSLNWGAAILGLVIAAGFTQWNKQHAVVLLIFFIFTPLFSAMTMFLWLGEAVRFKRAGDYICLIEQKAGMVLDDVKQKYSIKENWDQLKRHIEESIRIPSTSNDLDLSDPLAWEQWLKDMKGKGPTVGHLAMIYKIRLGFFILLMSFSFITGNYYVFTHPKFIPSWLLWVAKAIPEPRNGILILISSSGIIILAAILVAIGIGRNLDVHTKPFSRRKYKKMSNHANAAERQKDAAR